MKRVLLAGIIMMVTGIILMCISSCNKKPQAISMEGNGIQVEYLFEKDGIKVYRFYDGGDAHYFTSRGETMSNQSEGKSTVQENIN